MIKKMVPVPAEFKNNFGTAQANMAKVVVRVVEGESTVPERMHAAGVVRGRSAAVICPRVRRWS